jgi:AhpD family alkylhydroperoxidase
MTEINPFEVFRTECPDIARAFDTLVEAQRDAPGLDNKTKQLVNIALQTATRNPRGVFFHAAMARDAGASREEVKTAVVMALHLVGLAAVLDCLPSALEGYEKGPGIFT